MPATETARFHPLFFSRLEQLAARRPLRLGEDLFAADGGKLLAKGSLLSADWRVRLHGQRLQPPLETCLDVEGFAAAAAIKEAARRQWARFPLLQVLFVRPADRNACLAILETLPLNAPLSLYLALMEVDGKLDDHIRACLLAIGISRLLALPSNQQHQLALAALLRDIGQFYLDPAQIEARHQLDAAAWRHYADHPRISSKQILAVCQLKQPEPIARAVLQHHERLDGSGYPAHGRGEQVDIGGQVLLAADTVSELLARYPDAQARIDIALKIQPEEMDYAIVSALCQLLRRLDAPAAGPAPVAAEALHQLLHHIGRITQQFWRLKEEEGELSAAGQTLLDDTMQRFNAIQRSLFSTGADEIEQLPAQDDLIRRELDGVVCEIRWRLSSLAREIALRQGQLPEAERGEFMTLARLLMPGEDDHD
nr:HD domain-containing phosphohydrolase [Chromobacterium sp. ASV5]